MAQQDLGSRRKLVPDSPNTVWKSEYFRSSTDYTQTDFENAIAKLTKVATQKRTDYKCSEAVWRRCHRAIISDYLKKMGRTMMHSKEEGMAKEHPYTSAYL